MTLSGTLPLYNEAGQLVPSVTRRMEGWWNLRPDRWETALIQPPRPVPARPARVLRLLSAAVPRPNPCRYRLSFRVPDAEPGTYPVELLLFGGGGAGGLAPVRFTIVS